jgi:aspartate/methionine/tyrosine aminotransferase
MLATAYLYANDEIEEAASFAEVGGYVFYDEAYHKVCMPAALHPPYAQPYPPR